jgi:hypothetical protein
MPAMRKCPVGGCLKTVQHGCFVCWAHWQRLPQHVKDHLSAANHRYKQDEISCAELRSVIAEVVANLQGTDVDRVDDAPRTTPVGSCSCGKLVLLPVQDEYPLPVTVDPNGTYVIVGGRVEPAEGSDPSYTRFSRHLCRPRYTATTVTSGTAPQFQTRTDYVGPPH